MPWEKARQVKTKPILCPLESHGLSFYSLPWMNSGKHILVVLKELEKGNAYYFFFVKFY